MSETSEAPAHRSTAVRLAAGLTALETVALVGYMLAIAIAARNTRGSTESATVSELVFYGMFAALMAWLAWGLWRLSPLARTPFLVTQAFVFIVGYTVFVGDGVATTISGVLLMLVGLAGIVLGFSPALARGLLGEVDE